jgi:hypothetical protein
MQGKHPAKQLTGFGGVLIFEFRDKGTPADLDREAVRVPSLDAFRDDDGFVGGRALHSLLREIQPNRYPKTQFRVSDCHAEVYHVGLDIAIFDPVARPETAPARNPLDKDGHLNIK